MIRHLHSSALPIFVPWPEQPWTIPPMPVRPQLEAQRIHKGLEPLDSLPGRMPRFLLQYSMAIVLEQPHRDQIP